MTDTTSVPMVRCRSLGKAYPSASGTHQVLGPIDLDIPRGQFIALLGPSGCGKSTLLRLISGLTTTDIGSVEVDGERVTAPRTEAGFVFQAPVLLEWLTVLGNIRLQAVARDLEPNATTERALELLDLMGLDRGMANRRPSQLSGGQQQRVSIARALLHEPPLLLMDEPFGALDAITRDQIGNDLQRVWQGLETTVVLVTHSIEEAVFLADRVVVMSNRPGTIKLDLPIELPTRTIEARETDEFRDYAARLRHAIEI